jgi:hypothetical protein
MHFTCRSFIGKNTTNWWSQYWENEPDDSTKYTKGHLFGVISLSSNNSISLIQQGHELIDQINSEYFSDSSSSTINSFNQIIQKIKQKINPDEQLDLALVLILNNQIFIAVLGDIEVNLQRQNQISRLIQGNSSVSTISGPIKNLDRIFITSSKFIQQFTQAKIKTILFDEKIQNIEETFLTNLYSLDDQSLLSAALIEVHDEENDSQPTTSPEIEATETLPETPNHPEISPVYVRQRLNFKIGNYQKIRLFIALILLIGLSVSFYFGHQKNKSEQAESKFSQYKTELEQKLNNISAVKSLDLDTAYQTAKEAQEIINNMSTLKIHPNEVSQYQSQISSVLSQTGDSASFNPDMVYDTSLITSNPQFSKILFSKNLLYLLDSSSGRLDTLNPAEKSTKNISISDQIKSAKKILLDSNQTYLLFDNQIKLVEKEGLTSKLNFNDYSSVNITDLQFWNGSVYVLDNSTQTVWKFTPNSSGYSEPQNWLKNDLKLEIGSKYLAIDGQIWTLTSSGSINLYISGVKDNFKQKQTFDISSVSSFSTDPDSDYLIIADKSKFIYVYRKNGEFVSKYNLDKFDLLDISLDAANKIIYFLASDQKIYKITL